MGWDRLVYVWRHGLCRSIFWPCRPDGVEKWMGMGLIGGGGLLQLSAWVDGMGRRGLRCGIDLGVLCAQERILKSVVGI